MVYREERIQLTKEFIQEQLNCGKSLAGIAREFSYATSTVVKAAKKHNVVSNARPGPRRLRRQRYCLYCRTPLIGRTKRNNKYCDRLCWQTHKAEDNFAKWARNEWISAKLGLVLRTSIIEQIAQGKCELCGWREKNPFSGAYVLHIHHKDGKNQNNKRNNIAVLCPNCHSLTENYCGLNMKKK